jgi:hypothetical protein
MPMTDEQRSNLQSLYADRHKMHLLQNYPQMVASMQAKGTLEAYLEEIGRQAARMYELIIDQMTEKAAEMPETKRQSYLDSAPLVASEMVASDIVYVKL